jgi:hypothetical protein
MVSMWYFIRKVATLMWPLGGGESRQVARCTPNSRAVIGGSRWYAEPMRLYTATTRGSFGSPLGSTKESRSHAPVIARRAASIHGHMDPCFLRLEAALPPVPPLEEVEGLEEREGPEREGLEGREDEEEEVEKPLI